MARNPFRIPVSLIQDAEGIFCTFGYIPTITLAKKFRSGLSGPWATASNVRKRYNTTLASGHHKTLSKVKSPQLIEHVYR